jgi:hypothetical protein
MARNYFSPTSVLRPASFGDTNACSAKIVLPQAANKRFDENELKTTSSTWTTHEIDGQLPDRSSPMKSTAYARLTYQFRAHRGD